MLFTSALFYAFIGLILIILLIFSFLSLLPFENFLSKIFRTTFHFTTCLRKKRFSLYNLDDLYSSTKFGHYNTFLLSTSLLFYGLLNGKMLLLLLAVITWDFILAKSIYASKISHKKYYLFVSLSLNLGILFFYKYAAFIAKECLNICRNMIDAYAFNSIGWNFSLQSLSFFSSLDGVILPLGISFFTFQSLSYTIDVYRGKVVPTKSWTDYALYVSFFPQLVAGPIVKAKDFLPQIYNRLAWAEIPLFSAISWIAMGLIKKSILADRLATIVDSIFLSPNALDWSFICLGVLSYTIQIFLDFSGYSDIAIGLALLFGFRLPTNFNMPYLSSSFSEFWNRWHITLSSWLRDYLYIPLGGNRIGKFYSYRNLFIVMLLGGIWHGASWNFLVWGGLHGILLAIERMFWRSDKSRKFSDLENSSLGTKKSYLLKTKSHFLDYLQKAFSVAFVFLVTNFLWIFFRSPNWEITRIIFSKIFSLEAGLTMPYSWKIELLTILAIVMLGHFAGIKKFHPENWEKIPLRFEYSLLLAIITIGIALLSVTGKPFIYFVF
jgi:alginate O-acetyltransferase complex protein AlgI